LQGTAAAIFIVLHASALMRHAFYEVFLHLHFLSAVFLMVVLWMHLNGLYQQMWLAVAIVAWGAEVGVVCLCVCAPADPTSVCFALPSWCTAAWAEAAPRPSSKPFPAMRFG
jgi:hypothetical protein